MTALRGAGAQVYQLSAKDLPDLLVGARGRWVLLEVKSEEGALRPGQATFHLLAGAARLSVAVVRTPEEALHEVGFELEVVR